MPVFGAPGVTTTPTTGNVPPDMRNGTTSTDGNTLTTSNVDQLAALSGLMSGLQSTATLATGQAAAANMSATGAAAEATAYGMAGATSTENAKIAGIAGDISILQQQRQVAASAGQQQAAAGAGGATLGGSVYDVMQSSYQQGAVGSQLIGVQAALEQGGYIEAGEAAQAEVAGAQAQQQAAIAEANAYTAQASQAAAQTAQLQSAYDKQLSQLDNISSNPPAEPAAPHVIRGGFQGVNFKVTGLNQG